MRDARAIGGEVRPGLLERQTTVCRAVGVCRTRPARGCRSYLGRVSSADRTLTTLRLATTRDGQVDTGDEAGLVRGEPRDGCGYFVSTAEATKRRLPSSGGTIVGCHVGSDDARRNGVDPDSLGGDLRRQTVQLLSHGRRSQPKQLLSLLLLLLGPVRLALGSLSGRGELCAKLLDFTGAAVAFVGQPFLVAGTLVGQALLSVSGGPDHGCRPAARRPLASPAPARPARRHSAR